MGVEPGTRLSHEEYFALERESDVRHEYLAGKIYALGDSSPVHSELSANVIAALGTQLRGRGCKVYTGDLRIAIQQLDIYTYPDVSVVCGVPQFSEHQAALINPTVIVEVLSPSTAEYDQGQKLLRYQQLASLRSYILVAQTAPFIWCLSRDEGGRWIWSGAEGLASSLALPSVDCDLSLAEIYGEVTFGEAIA